MTGTWAVLDTETTGLSSKTDRIIEFAAARFNPQTGQLIGQTLHLYINPGRPIPQEATRIHGIDDTKVQDKPVFADVAQDIMEFVAGSTLVIQNAPFDVGFLNAEFSRCKRKPFESFAAKIICTRRLARCVRPGRPASLDALCTAFGIDRSARTLHGALIDCELLAAVYPHLVRLEQEQINKIIELLPFSPDDELPKDLHLLGNGHIAISEVIKRLEKEQERIEVLVRELTGSKTYEDRDFTVKFGEPGTRTDWAGVTADHLANVDLSPYRSSTAPRLSIKPT